MTVVQKNTAIYLNTHKQTTVCACEKQKCKFLMGYYGMGEAMIISICVCISIVTYMALSLWLVTILSHNLLKGNVKTQDLGHDIYTAHNDLIEMTIAH